MFREGQRASELGLTAHLDGVAELVSIALVWTCGAPMYWAVRALRPDVAIMRSGVRGKRFGNELGTAGAEDCLVLQQEALSYLAGFQKFDQDRSFLART